MMTVPFLGFSFSSKARVNAFAYKCTASYKYAASARILREKVILENYYFKRFVNEPVLRLQSTQADSDS